MDSRAKLYIERAENEITFAKVAFKISSEVQVKESLEIVPSMTFYSQVISHAYYCIFYSAKAVLAENGIETKPPEEHKKTLDEFEKKLVKTGMLDAELLKIYRSIVVRADELLGIFSFEKKKRGQYTYKRLPQANVEPSKESIVNAEKFFKNIYKVLR
ncbi:MAG: HEPN domain-containing protein [Nanoarchaeota archaeon]|nr:HEPN domain-containing protein [Thermodesulfovibrionia bacterium]MCK5281809.1 HEPN domain-containing protein [Nanoarchaeota archaeon]